MVARRRTSSFDSATHHRAARVPPRRLACACALFLWLFGAGSARAQTVREDFYITDGTVNAEVLSGNTLYIGGSFSRAGSVTGSGIPIDATTGLALSGFPRVVGAVLAVVADGADGWYIGGVLTTVGGQPRSNVAHVLADNSVSPWNPGANGAVRTLALSGTTVYAGGDFTSAAGQPRNRIVALDASSGVATAWDPNADGSVRVLTVDGGLVYAGGSFTSIGGQGRSRIAALDGGTALATAWNPDANSQVFAIVVSGGTVYAGGQFTAIGGQIRNRIAALDGGTGLATGWNPNASGQVTAIALAGGTVYAGGLFTTVGGQVRNRIAALDGASGLAMAWNPNANLQVSALVLSGATLYAGGDFSSIGAAPRNRIAALDVTTGLATTWDPGAYGTVLALAVQAGTVYAGGTFSGMGGVRRNNLAAMDITSGTSTPWDPNANNEVLALGMAGGAVYAGGSFTSVGGQTRNRIAAIDVATGLATAWNPSASGEVSALAVNGVTLYAGGNFTSVGGQARNNVAALDITTGLATPWNPNANGQIFALEPGQGTVYAGGLFSSIGGQIRNSIAAIDSATGLSTAWNANANGTIRALDLSCGTLYAAGFFTTIGGQARNRIAALDVSSGAATPWNPNASGPVFAMGLRDGRLYLGGIFFSVGGQSRQRLAALDPVTGFATGWDPGVLGTVRTLAVGGGSVYAGGSFTAIDGLDLSNLAAMTADPSFSCPMLAVTPSSIPTGVVGVAYSQMLSAVGGTAPYCFAATAGSLPAGLTLVAGTGEIVGTPASAGTSVFTVGVTDANGCTGGAGYVLSVFATPPGSTVAANTSGLCISPGHPCVSVPVKYMRSEAAPARAISVMVQLDVTKLGLCTPGTPAASIQAGTWLADFGNTVFQVVDNGGGSYTVDQTILGSPCGVMVGGELFTMDLMSVGGDGTGAITVTSVLARDCDGAVIPAVPGAPAQLAVQNAPIPILPTSLAGGSGGFPYSQAITAGAGVAPFTWALTAGLLPQGLSLSAAGVISGTPTALETTFFTVGVTDANDCVGNRAYSLEIGCGNLAVRPIGLGDGVVGLGYTNTLTTTGGIAPFTWSVTAGSLPAGLALVAGTGEIVGTPASAGTSVFTVGVTDANGCTGGAGYVLSVFVTPPGSTVAANTSGLCISTAHPCVSVPVEYMRSEAAPARAISVTVQLDVTKLGLCTPGTPAASIQAGTWLADFGNTVFQVVDNGGGSYTVDQTILGSPCGVMVGGELFTMDLMSVGGDGTGAITVTSVKARDCDGAVIPAVPGAPAGMTIQSVAPAVITDLATAQVLSGNGSGPTTGVTTTWTTGGSGTVSLYRAPFGTYPEYDDGGPVFPPDPGLAPGAPWALVAAAASSGYVDHPAGRGFWHYVALVTDACGNVSAVSNMTAGSLNYHLGDVSDGVTAGQGNNLVEGVDVSLLGANYGIVEPEITTRGVAYLDVGPTVDLQPTSRPSTDDNIDFEDLILFAVNYELVSSPALAARPARVVGTEGVSRVEEFRVVAPSLVEGGETVTALLWLKGGGRVQGFSAELAWDATVVEPVEMESGQWVEGQGGVVLTPGPGVVDAALLGVRGQGMEGEGVVARVRFRALRAGDAGIRLANVKARDGRNRPLGEGGVVARAEALRPGRTVLLAPKPNPARGGERAELEFGLAEAGMVELAIYGVDGRRVRALVQERREVGVYREAWDGRDEGGHASASGVYYARLTAGGRRFTQVLLRVR